MSNALTLVKRVTSLPGYTSSVGTEVVFAEPGVVTMQLARKPDLLQFQGNFHGGVIAGLADHAAGGAATTALPAGRIGVTVNLLVNYIAPANGERIIARARTVKGGGTISLVNVEVFSVTGEQEALCATANVTLRSVDLPS